MANIINMGGGSFSPVLLASLTTVPTSSTAISGTENWKKYDVIYFECTIHYSVASDKAIFTNAILTHNVTIGGRYQPFRIIYGNMDRSLYVLCYFSENALKVYKETKSYDVVKLNIYGVKF